MDEIFFFKIIKPKFFSKLIYYRKVYNIEMMRPNGQDCVLKNYFINELNQLENFYNKNIDFYKYYRSGSTHLDKKCRSSAFNGVSPLLRPTYF